MVHEFEVTKLPPFPSRQLLLTSANMLKALGHSGFEALRLEYDLLETSAGLGSGLAARATSLATYAVANPERHTPDGIYLQSAIVARAGEIYRDGIMANIGEKEREAFKRASSSAGTMNDVSEFGTYIVSVPDHEFAGSNQKRPPAEPGKQTQQVTKTRKVFVVHGHDHEVREKVARFLAGLDFDPIILDEQTNKGRTLIEKFEAHADVGFAVILLTPDDRGGSSDSVQQSRARQNVILEWGYFIARLGRSGVLALKRGDIELPSDSIGIVWEPFDEYGGWKNKLARELQDAGFTVDWEKVGRS